jgi:hypothetical protein
MRTPDELGHLLQALAAILAEHDGGELDGGAPVGPRSGGRWGPQVGQHSIRHEECERARRQELQHEGQDRAQDPQVVKPRFHRDTSYRYQGTRDAATPLNDADADLLRLASLN